MDLPRNEALQPISAHVKNLAVQHFATRAEDGVEAIELALARYAPLLKDVPEVARLEASARAMRDDLAGLYASLPGNF
jgi:hypothetical protein